MLKPGLVAILLAAITIVFGVISQSDPLVIALGAVLIAAISFSVDLYRRRGRSKQV